MVAKPIAAVAVPVKPKPAVVAGDVYHDEFAFDAAPKKSKSKAVVEDDEDDAPRQRKKSKAALDDDVPRRSKKKAIVDEDDADDDDMPRKGKKSKKKFNPLVFVVLGLVSLMAVSFVGVMVWYVAIRENKDGTTGTKSDVPIVPVNSNPLARVFMAPAGWTKHEKGAFSAYFQDTLQNPEGDSSDSPEAAMVVEKRDGKRVWGLAILPAKMGAAAYADNLSNLEAGYQNAERILNRSGGLQVIDRKGTTIDGHPAKELKVQDLDSPKSKSKDAKGYVRVVFAHSRLYFISVQAPDWAEADEMARIFFGSVKLKP